jgi:TonB family protein
MDRFGPGDWLKLTVAGPPIRKIGHEGAITLQFGPKEAEQKVGYYLGHLGKDLPALFLDQRVRVTPLTKEEEQVLKSSKVGFVDPARISAERLSAVSELNIGRPLQKPTRLMLGSIKQPLEAMDKCTDELLTHWGIDVAKYKTQSRRLRSRPRSGSWIDWSDYPPKMIEQRRRSILHVRLNVDETGLPTACHVQKSSGPKEFEDAVCGALMKRARFDPALDAEGKPFASVLTQGVTFDIP